MRDTKDFLLIEERLPHIASNIDAFWGTGLLVDYIHRLLLDTRDGTRRGFPHDCSKALCNLQALHDETFPAFKRVQVTDWKFG